MNKLNAAESLRGIACLAVVFSHFLGVFFPQLHSFYVSSLPEYDLAKFLYNSPFSFFYSGTGAVFVFFVLSGYVLTLSFMKTKDRVRKFKESLVKRYPRLAIPALLSCLLMCAVFYIPVDLTNVSEWFRGVRPNDFSFSGAIYSGLIGSFIFGDKTYNPVLWTMQIELLGSLIIYLLCFFYDNKRNMIFTLFLSLTFSFWISPLVFLGIFSFLIGFCIYFFNCSLGEKISCFLLLLGIYFCGVHNNSFSYSLIFYYFNNYTYFIFNFLGGVLIVFSVLKSQFIQNGLNNKFLVKLGELSFSIYLTHLFVMYLVGIPLFNFFYKLTGVFLFSSFISVITSLFFTYFFSIFYSKYVDQTSIKISNYLAKKL